MRFAVKQAGAGVFRLACRHAQERVVVNRAMTERLVFTVAVY